MVTVERLAIAYIQKEIKHLTKNYKDNSNAGNKGQTISHIENK